MKSRFPTYPVAGLLLAAVLVCASTSIGAGSKQSSASWIGAQQHMPLLWMVDGCALLIFIGTCLLGTAVAGLRSDQVSQTDDNTRHIEMLTETLQDIFRQHQENTNRIDDLEELGDSWRQGFEDEARQLTEQAFRALADNIESNAHQLEAVNLALRYQRAEMQAFRTAFKSGELPSPVGPPPALDAAAQASRPILPEWRKPEKEPEPVGEIEIEPDLAAQESAQSEAPEPFTEDSFETETATAAHAEISANEPSAQPEPANEIANDETAVATIVVEEEANTADAIFEPVITSDQTVNSGSTVVTTLEMDLSTDSAVVREVEEEDTIEFPDPKAASAAEEFRRGREVPFSIFRRRRT